MNLKTYTTLQEIDELGCIEIKNNKIINFEKPKINVYRNVLSFSDGMLL